jgi:hypothetical protein
VPQPGQRERGRTTDSPLGTLYTTTLMKEPNTKPNSEPNTARRLTRTPRC